MQLTAKTYKVTFIDSMMELLNLGTGTHSLILHCTGDLANLLLTLRSIHCRTPSFWLSLFLMCEFLDKITSPIYCTKFKLYP